LTSKTRAKVGRKRGKGGLELQMRERIEMLT